MTAAPLRIAVVAPSSRASPEIVAPVQAIATGLYGARAPEIAFHPQCFASSGHFAGDDATRAAAIVEVANDPAFDAVWFARGGYGAGRLVEAVLPRLTEAARRKVWLGYSDGGALLAALYGQGFTGLANGPMPQDILRDGGEERRSPAPWPGWSTAIPPRSNPRSAQARRPPPST